MNQNNVLDKINEVYGVTRMRRMEDLYRGAQAPNPVSVERFLEFTERFGKVADDMAIFLTNDGNLQVNWSTWNHNAHTQRRGYLTKHCRLTFFAEEIEVYRDAGVDQQPWITTLESQELSDVIDLYRTHRLPA